MNSRPRTFRVFVSSTFIDLADERNALQRWVFPRLRELCAEHGHGFQAVDLRWSINSEASLDQRTMRICLGELSRCQDLSPRPNFIALLGDRYGWEPLPEEIPDDEYQVVRARIAARPVDLGLLNCWYRRDLNATPPRWILRPREPGTRFADYDTWRREVEAPLLAALRAATGLAPGSEQPPSEELRLRYGVAATHREIELGALSCPDDARYAFAFLRTTVPERAGPLTQLRVRLRGALGANVVEWRNPPGQHGPPAGYEIGDLPNDLEACRALLGASAVGRSLCEAVWIKLGSLILAECRALSGRDPLDDLREAHLEHLRQRATPFFDRGDGMQERLGLLLDEEEAPLIAVLGPAGSGKSALLGQALATVLRGRGEPRPLVVVRSLGATPDTLDLRPLLEGLCSELAQALGEQPLAPPGELPDLVAAFHTCLGRVALQRPLVLVLDGLDRLHQAGNARRLGWLPATLPPGLKLLLSAATEPADEAAAAIQRRLGPDRLVVLRRCSEGWAEQALTQWLLASPWPRRLHASERAAVLQAAAHSGFPLHLRLLASEARLWQRFEDAPRPERGALPTSVEAALAMINARLRQTSEHGALLPTRVLACLAVSRVGLSEDELIDILSRDIEVYASFLRSSHHPPPDLLVACSTWDDPPPGEPGPELAAWVQRLCGNPTRLRSLLAPPHQSGLRLPMAVWARLRHDLGVQIEEIRHGEAVLLRLAQPHLGQVALRDPTEGDPQARHAGLAAYFTRRAHAGDAHALVELPWALAGAGEQARLADLLTSIHYLDARARCGDIYGLIDDFSLLDGPFDEASRPWRGFLLRHAHRLRAYPNLLFTLLHREGHAEGLTAARRLASSGAWVKPWLELAPVLVPPLQSVNADAPPVVSRQTSCSWPPSAAVALAQRRGLAFFLRSLGSIGIADVDIGRTLPDTISVPPKRPLTLAAAPNAGHLAAAFDDGSAALVSLELDQQGLMVQQRISASFRYLLPEMEDPIMAFTAGALWYQGEDGALRRWRLSALDEPPDLVPLPPEARRGELSGLALAHDAPIAATFRCGRDTQIVPLSRDGSGQARRVPGVDVACVAAAASARALIAFSDSRISVFQSTSPPFAEIETVASEAATRLGAEGDMILWIGVRGTLNRWMAGSAPPAEVPGGGREWLKARELAPAGDGAFRVVTPVGAQRFSLGGRQPATSRVVAAFPTPAAPGYCAVRSVGHRIELIGAGTPPDSLVAEEPDPAVAAALERHWAFGLDGARRLLGARSTGEGFLVDAGRSRALRGLPPQVTAIAGHPDGGFFLTDIGGRLFHAGPDGSPWPLVGGPSDVAGASSLRCFPGLGVWSGLCHVPTAAGRDILVTLLLFDPARSLRGRLDAIGSVDFPAGSGDLAALAAAPARNLLVTVWNRAGHPHLTLGSVQDHLRRRHRSVALRAGQADISVIALTAGGAALYLLDEAGDLFLLDLATIAGDHATARPVCSGTAKLTDLSTTNVGDGVGPLLVEERTHILAGRFHEEKS